jgi:hypothetical protein
MAEGRKLHLSKTKCEEINRKNRELRVQIKSMLKDSINSSTNKQAEKVSSTKRELIKQRNYLMQENDALLFQFKKLFLF